MLPKVNSELDGIKNDSQNMSEQLSNEEKKGVFRIVAGRIKRAFSKDKNSKIVESGTKLVGDLQKTTDSIDTYMKNDINYSTSYSERKINVGLENRENLQSQISSDEEKSGPTEFIEKVSHENRAQLDEYVKELTPVNTTEDILKYLYKNDYKGAIKNPVVAQAYENYCKVTDKNNEIHNLEQSISQNNKIINLNGNTIENMKEKMEELIRVTNKSMDIFNIIHQQLDSMKEKITLAQKGIEKRESNGVFSLISERIKNAFSKTKLLPEFSRKISTNI